MKNESLITACLFFSIFLFAKSVFAQVPVRNEPHHKVVLENDYVRLIEVHIKPHDTTLTHIHAAPSSDRFSQQVNDTERRSSARNLRSEM